MKLYTLEIILDYAGNTNDPVDSQTFVFDSLEGAGKKAKEFESEVVEENGCYQSVEIYEGSEDDQFEEILYQGSSKIKELPENGILVFFKHKTYMNYAHEITDVRGVGGRFNTYKDLPYSDDHTGVEWCSVYDSPGELLDDMEGGWGIFGKLQSGKHFVEDYLIEKGMLDVEED